MNNLNTVTNTRSECFRTKITILNDTINGHVTNYIKPIHCEIVADNKINASVELIQALNVECTDVVDTLSVQITTFDKLLSNIIVLIVCSQNVDSGYYLYVQEGIFILSDGNKFELIKDEL